MSPQKKISGNKSGDQGGHLFQMFGLDTDINVKNNAGEHRSVEKSNNFIDHFL